MLVATFAAQSEPLNYEIEFAPQGSATDAPLTMFCFEKSPCRGEIELHVGEKVQPVTVDPIFVRDHVLIFFRAPNMPLTVDRQEAAVRIPLDSSQTGQLSLTLRGPALPEQNDLVARIIEWPVKPFTKTIDVYIRPSR